MQIQTDNPDSQSNPQCTANPQSASLPLTEQENPRTRQISSLPTMDVVRLMHEEDARVAVAVRKVLPDVARAVDGITARLENGGRLFYIGAGTSGRLGVLDASECPPTFGVSCDLVQGIMAGGYDALYRATETSEDDKTTGVNDLLARGANGRDAIVGIAASGRTPYTIGAIEKARAMGAFTVALSSTPESELARAAEVAIEVLTGAEVIAGSTRLKAGTAHKMILNMISTATMIRLGYVVGNRMSNVQPRNEKLRARAVRILAATENVSEDTAQKFLMNADGDLARAFVMARTNCTREQASEALVSTNGVVEKATAKILHPSVDSK
ncbi:MAG: N-acetylmuramic acid 6-phosphate etherase [Pyrinomonadaceae bacterium]